MRLRRTNTSCVRRVLAVAEHLRFWVMRRAGLEFDDSGQEERYREASFEIARASVFTRRARVPDATVSDMPGSPRWCSTNERRGSEKARWIYAVVPALARPALCRCSLVQVPLVLVAIAMLCFASTVLDVLVRHPTFPSTRFSDQTLSRAF